MSKKVDYKLNKIKKAVCLVSGGLDSTVVAGIAKKKKFTLYFLFINYGQKTVRKELNCFRKIVKYYNPEGVKIIEMKWIKDLGVSGLFDSKIQLNETNSLLEYVPFRNTLLLSAATAWAEVLGAASVFIGSSGSDHICPDNSPDYIKSFQNVIRNGTLLKKDIKLEAPLVKIDKRKTVSLGIKINTPFEFTWSCNNNTKVACGHCSNCIPRIDAFRSLKKTDPIPYERNL